MTREILSELQKMCMEVESEVNNAIREACKAGLEDTVARLFEARDEIGHAAGAIERAREQL